MKRISITPYILFILLIFLNFTSAHAKVIKHTDIKPFVPSIMGMGGGFVAQAYGLPSLWTNPAGLATQYTQHDNNSSEFTVFAINAMTQPYPTDLYNIILGLTTVFETQDASSFIDRLLDTGIRGNLSFHTGFITQSKKMGFAFALSNTSSVYAYSFGSILSTHVMGVNQSELMLGYARSFRLRKSINLELGVTVRPLFRTHNEVSATNLLNFLVETFEVTKLIERVESYHGFGVGFDTGAKLAIYGVTFGIAIRDIYTPLFYTKKSITNYFQGIGVSESFADTYIIPLSFDMGISYKIAPDLLDGIFETVLYVQYTDVLDTTKLDTTRKRDLAYYIHIGSETTLLAPFFKVQLGFNKGYPTFGFKADIWALDISLTVYAQEEGYRIRELTSPGMAAEVAFRW